MLLSYFIILIIFGLIMLTSASSVIGFDKFQDTYFFVKRQLVYGIAPGFFAFLFFAKLPYETLKPIGTWIFYISVALLVTLLIPGVGANLGTGASSWISIGAVSFQPAELAKLGTIFFLAAYLVKLGRGVHDFRHGFLVALGLGMIPIVLTILQPDVGTASILFVIVFGMLFAAGAKMSHLSGLMACAVIAFFILIFIAPYRAARFTTFLHPELDPQGIGYHINQAFLAVGSGGWLGQGLGGSKQKFQYLPEVHADSVFAIIAEEMGFIVTAGLIFLLLLIARRVLHVAGHAPDDFGRLLVVGIIIWLMAQSFFNIGAMLGLMPITGVPLPFISHGGTALALAMASVGVLVNVSKHASDI